MRAALFAWMTASACGSHAARTETNSGASKTKCCCLASFGDDFVADEADLPMQPAALPKYPEIALTGHWSAKVLLGVSVDLAGRPKSMRVEKLELSGGPKYAPGTTRDEELIRHAFEAATIEAAKLWRFKDCTEYGWPAARSAMVPVDFHWDAATDKPAAANAPATKH